MKKLLVSLIFVVIGSSAIADWWLPERRFVAGYFEVTGVAANDVLNIRDKPSGSSVKIGYFEPDRSIVEVLGTNQSGRWGYVQAGEVMGWTSMRYLTPSTLVTFGGTDIPVGLVCFTEEPFVNYTLGNGYIKISQMDSSAVIMPILDIESADETYEVTYEINGIKQRLSVTLSAKGSSSMADIEYQWSFRTGYAVGGCSYGP